MTIIDLIRRLSEAPFSTTITFQVDSNGGPMECIVAATSAGHSARRSFWLSRLETELNPDFWLDWLISQLALAASEKASSVPMKYVLAQSEDFYTDWLLRTKTPSFHAIYLDGERRIHDRISPGCLIKLDYWHLNQGYTLAFRQALSCCATAEDWSREDMARGLVEVRQ